MAHTWTQFLQHLESTSATFALAPLLPAKAECVKAIKSREYARRCYPELESVSAFQFVESAYREFNPDDKL